MTAKQIIDTLVSQGITKWRIAKEVGVTWNSVHLWHREAFKPTPDKKEKLEKLLKQP